jgi:UDP-N-acetyl-D-mannosaminuronate dehydrogenase
VKETAYSGVFDLQREVAKRGGRALVSDPLYTGEELTGLGLEPWTGGAIDAVIVQADHDEYSELGPEDVPGARVVFDGRGVLDPEKWEGSGVSVVVIGQGSSID